MLRRGALTLNRPKRFFLNGGEEEPPNVAKRRADPKSTKALKKKAGEPPPVAKNTLTLNRPRLFIFFEGRLPGDSHNWSWVDNIDGRNVID